MSVFHLECAKLHTHAACLQSAMSTTYRPSLEAFRRAGWLPVNQEAYDTWMHDLSTKISNAARSRGGEARGLLQPVQDLKTFIETNPTVYQEFLRMFDGVTESVRVYYSRLLYHASLTWTMQPKNYHELLELYNEIFRQAPSFGSLGPPMYMIMFRIMNSQAGFSAFTKEHLNIHFKKMLQTWELFLLSKDSRSVLHKDDKGWLCAEAIGKMLVGYKEGRRFEDVFVCDPTAEYYGYVSWEDFFSRRYKDVHTDRPTGEEDIIGHPTDTTKDLRSISSACQCTLYAIQEGVKKSDDLYIKDEAYSLVHLLANDPSVDYFVGGTVIQGFLNTTDYHRWHAPVQGTIKKLVSVPGTYFAQAPYTLDSTIAAYDAEGKEPPPPYLRSLRYFANTAARLLVFIESDNPIIGLMCFIAIGMTEISTCKATVYEGQHVKRGDELGTFCFGGSSCALVFRSEAKVKVGGDFSKPEAVLPINYPIAVATGGDPQN